MGSWGSLRWGGDKEPTSSLFSRGMLGHISTCCGWLHPTKKRSCSLLFLVTGMLALPSLLPGIKTAFSWGMEAEKDVVWASGKGFNFIITFLAQLPWLFFSQNKVFNLLSKNLKWESVTAITVFNNFINLMVYSLASECQQYISDPIYCCPPPFNA